MREAQPVVVQEYGPGVYTHPPLTGSLAQLAERVSRAGKFADSRLQPHALVAGSVRREEDGATLQIAHFTDGVMRKDVPGVMVGDGHRQPVYPCSVLDIIEHSTCTLVTKVGGEGEHRRLHQGISLYFRAYDQDASRYDGSSPWIISSIICMLPAVSPPSTGSTAPVIQAASSEAKNRAAPATSSGSPTRPNGYHFVRRSKTSGFALLRSSQAGVRKVPGAMALMRIPEGP